MHSLEEERARVKEDHAQDCQAKIQSENPSAYAYKASATDTNMRSSEFAAQSCKRSEDRLRDLIEI